MTTSLYAPLDFGRGSPYPPMRAAATKPKLISLAQARVDPTIVYRSVSHLDSRPRAPSVHYGRPKVISLEEARANPEIVYRSVAHIQTPVKQKPAPRPRLQSAGTLIPLSVAATRVDIKYRREGFEMVEHRRHILAVRGNVF